MSSAFLSNSLIKNNLNNFVDQQDVFICDNIKKGQSQLNLRFYVNLKIGAEKVKTGIRIYVKAASGSAFF
jgi:hypothetical protein